jgi:chromosome segregation ATPase
MRNAILKTATLSLALAFAGGACKKNDVEQKGEAAAKAQEEVNEAREDVKEAQAKVAEEIDDLNEARVEFRRTATERLNKIDQRLSELAAKTDEKSTKAAQELRQERDAIVARMNGIEQTTKSNWEEFKTDVNTKMDDLQKRIDAAF